MANGVHENDTTDRLTGDTELQFTDLRARPAATAPASAESALVLVVEDNPEMNRLLSESLTPYHRVVTAHDAAQGLERALALIPDLVLTEIGSAGSSGDQFVREIRSHRELDRTPIVLLAANDDDELRVRMLREGAQDYIIKPFAVEELRARVDWLLTAKQARETEARLASLVEFAPDGIFVADLDGRYTEVNTAGCRMLGYEREEIIGKTIVDLIPGDQVARLDREKQQLVRGEPKVSEWMLRKKDGGWLPVEVSAKILRDGRWHGFVRDISERKLQAEHAKRARDQLRESEERFRLTFEWAPIGMALVALDGRFVRVNQALCEIVGYGSEELMGRTFQEITHPEDLDADLDLAARLIRGEIPRYQLAKRYVRKHGTIVDVMLSGSVLRSETGQPLYFIAEIEDITGRKRREEELRGAQVRLELALRGADLAMWDWNVTSNDVVFNARWAELRGYRPDEIRGHVDTWISGVHPEDWPRVKLVLDEHFQGRRADYETEHRVRTKSGTWIWIQDRGKVVSRNQRGEPVRMAGIELDITARRQAEEQLRLAEAKSSGILSISADAIISIDKDQRITLFNEGAEKIFGYSRLEVVGVALELLIPERLRATHRQYVGRFAAGEGVSGRMGERGVATIFGLRKNGEEFPADAAISKLDVGNEQILTVVLRDITEQKRVERDQRFLAEAGAALAASLDYEDTLTTLARLAVRDLADYCIVDLVEERGEVRRLKVVAKDPARTRVGDLLEHVALDRSRPHLMYSALETRRPILIERLTPEALSALAQSEEHLRALEAASPRSVIAVPMVVHDTIVGVIALLSSTSTYNPADLQLAKDLADRAALAIENARLYRTSRRATQARDDVLGIVAHDLRNPLNSIGLQAELLRSAGDDRVREGAERIARSADRMNRLIQDLLDVARMEAGQLSVESALVPTRHLVVDAIGAQQPLAVSADIELQIAVPPALPDVWADRDRLLQIFENLIGNALKFTPSGGRITVGAESSNGAVLFRVTDTGDGIALEDQPHLFERFWQAHKAKRRGAGLGLPIVKGLIEAHGGRIWLESTPGQGSTFFFTIPTAASIENHEPTHAHTP